MLGVDLVAVLVAAVAMFMIGGLWYMGLFAKQWGEIFGFDKKSKKEQDAARKEMAPWIIVQVLITLVGAFALAKVMALAPSYDYYKVGLLVWGGFAAPVAISSVIFGGTDKKWIKRQISIMVSEYLVHILVAAWIIDQIQN